MTESKGIGGGGNDQVVGTNLVGIILLATDADVRTDGIAAHGAFRLAPPFGERLLQERDRGNKKENVATLRNQFLDQLERRECLAGATGHDELAAIMGHEAIDHVIDSRTLVRTQMLATGGLHGLFGGGNDECGPVDAGIAQILDADAVDGFGRVLEQKLGLFAPVVGGREDHALAERFLAERSIEGVQAALVEIVTFFIELALDADEIDAGVDLPVASGPVFPEPDVAELALVPGTDLEDTGDEALEEITLLARAL